MHKWNPSSKSMPLHLIAQKFRIGREKRNNRMKNSCDWNNSRTFQIQYTIFTITSSNYKISRIKQTLISSPLGPPCNRLVQDQLAWPEPWAFFLVHIPSCEQCNWNSIHTKFNTNTRILKEINFKIRRIRQRWMMILTLHIHSGHKHVVGDNI